MIRCYKGMTELDGDEVTLLSEISVICKALNQVGVSENSIKHAVEISFWSDEKIDEVSREASERMVEKFVEELEQSFSLMNIALLIKICRMRNAGS